MRSNKKSESLILPVQHDIQMGDLAPDGSQLRPHIVWFEEPVTKIEEAVEIVKSADIFLIVGTSLVVYPAAGLVNYAPWQIPKFIVDKNIPYGSSLYNLTKIEMPATEGMKRVEEVLGSL